MSPTGSTRSEPIRPAEIGGALFIPATHAKLEAILSGEKYPFVRCVVIDLEDAIDPQQRPDALRALQRLLPSMEQPVPRCFIRPYAPAALQELLTVEGIEKIDGFVLPKFGLRQFDNWLIPLRQNSFYFMPSLEGPELFSGEALQTLAELLRPFRQRIPTIRFGLEDMLRQLGMVRDCRTPLYALIAPSQVIASLINAFKPLGFNVSGGVYKCYEDDEGFLAEVREDLHQGLFGKTLIHPRQAALIAEAYKVPEEAFERAEAIVNAAHYVSSHHGIMLEKPTQFPWAKMILARAEIYGISGCA